MVRSDTCHTQPQRNHNALLIMNPFLNSRFATILQPWFEVLLTPDAKCSHGRETMDGSNEYRSVDLKKNQWCHPCFAEATQGKLTIATFSFGPINPDILATQSNYEPVF
jgi:hypothetical protein